MMEQARVVYLCNRYLNSEATAEELLELEFLLQDEQALGFLENAFTNAYAAFSPDEYRDLTRERADQIFKRIIAPSVCKAGSLSRIWFTAAAATIALIGGLSLWFFHGSDPSRPEVNMVSTAIVPGGTGATLTLADGRRVKLSDTPAGILAREAGLVITKTADGGLAYNLTEQPADSQLIKNSYHLLSTGKGEQYSVRLPDSSVVWLNAASKLKYPSSFMLLRERRVELEGEAYFEVSRQPDKPFIVQANGQEVRVLGTHFNVRSYADDPAAVTTLLEGRVQISSAGAVRLLKPGERALLSKGEIRVSAADLTEEMAWKNGYFYFNNEDIGEVMRKISRWYNVDPVYQDSGINEKFYGIISRNKNIGQVLSLLEQTKSVHFKVEGRRLLIMK